MAACMLLWTKRRWRCRYRQERMSTSACGGFHRNRGSPSGAVADGGSRETDDARQARRTGGRADLLVADKPLMEERIVLRNPGSAMISLTEFEMGFPLSIRDAAGKVRSDRVGDRISAVPFRHRADDGDGAANEFTFDRILDRPGWEYCSDRMTQPWRQGSRHHFSEGWAWLRQSLPGDLHLQSGAHGLQRPLAGRDAPGQSPAVRRGLLSGDRKAAVRAAADCPRRVGRPGGDALSIDRRRL